MAWQRSTRRSRLPPNWNQLRILVLERDNYQCKIRHPGCEGRATECDHINRGDNHHPTNLQAVCQECHKKKTVAERTVLRERRPAEHHPGLK